VKAILRAGWAIASNSWLLWLLHLLLLVAFVPTLMLTASVFGGLMALRVPWSPDQPAWLISLRQITPSGWLGLAGAAFTLFSGSSAVLLLLQAVAIRAARLAAEPGRHSTRQAFQIGMRRLSGIIKISLLLGMLLTLSGVALALQLPTDPEARLGPLLLAALAALLMGLVFFMLMLSIVLDNLDLGPAARRAAHMLRQRWQGFLPVFAISCLPLGGLLLAAVLASPFWALLGEINNSWLLLAVCGVTAPFVLYAVLVISVYTLSVHTVLYRARPPQPLLTAE
jgi:hypothetical protein